MTEQPDDAHISSDETEAYWPVEDSKPTPPIDPQEPKHCKILAHPSQMTANFSFSIHGIWITNKT